MFALTSTVKFAFENCGVDKTWVGVAENSVAVIVATEVGMIIAVSIGFDEVGVMLISGVITSTLKVHAETLKAININKAANFLIPTPYKHYCLITSFTTPLFQTYSTFWNALSNSPRCSNPLSPSSEIPK